MPEQHLDLDGLADLLAAERPDADQHLRSCAGCRTRLADLQAAMAPVAASLAALPFPDAPADLDERLTRSLDGLRTTAPRPAARRVRPPAARPAPRKLAWLPIAGGLAAAALVVGIVVANSRGGGPARSIDALSPSSVRTSSTGLGYAKDGRLLASELPALLNGTATGQSTAEAVQPRHADPKGTLGSSSPATDSAADPLARLRTTQGLASCLTALYDGTPAQLPLALDYAQFEQQPALVVVLPSKKQTKVDVFVVGAGCAPADAQVLYFARLPAAS